MSKLHVPKEDEVKFIFVHFVWKWFLIDIFSLGSFEVIVNDTLIHSKLAQLAFPSNKDVAINVQNAIDGKPLQKVQEQPITDCTIQWWKMLSI